MSLLTLNERQQDALAEFINVAFGRTGASLSELAGRRVLLEPPQLSVCAMSELGSTLSQYIPGEAAAIHQQFTGPITGDAFLLMSSDGARRLVSLLDEEIQGPVQLNESAMGVLTEVGNILLSTCLGMFGELLQVRFSFSVPLLHLATVNHLPGSLSKERKGSSYALIVFTCFRLKNDGVKGYLVLVLTTQSLDQLISDIEAWELRKAVIRNAMSVGSRLAASSVITRLPT